MIVTIKSVSVFKLGTQPAKRKQDIRICSASYNSERGCNLHILFHI